MAALKNQKLVFKTNYRLMQVKSIAECSKASILQYFRPSLSYHLAFRSLFYLFFSCRFTQVLLYPCGYCSKAVKWTSSGIRFNSCNIWYEQYVWHEGLHQFSLRECTKGNYQVLLIFGTTKHVWHEGLHLFDS